jgi:hypothetical protein
MQHKNEKRSKLYEKKNVKKHTKFDCPKLHFVPLKQHIMNKFIYK